MKNLVANLGLKGITLFVFIILLNPFYKSVFPYADILIITVAAFLCFWYLEEYFCLLREGIQNEIETNKNDLKIFEKNANEKFAGIDAAIDETCKRIDNSQTELTNNLSDISNGMTEKFNEVFIKDQETKDNINLMQNNLVTRLTTVGENVDAAIGDTNKKIESSHAELANNLTAIDNSVTKQFDEIFAKDRETKANINTMQNELITRITTVGENVDAAIVETNKKTEDGQAKLASALKDIDEATAKQFQDVFVKDKETKDNICTLQNDLIAHINTVADNIKKQSENQANVIDNTINAVNKLAVSQFTETLVGIKGLKGLLEANAEAGLKQTNELKETQSKLSDTLQVVKSELGKDAESKQKTLNDTLADLKLIITKGQETVGSKFESLTDKMTGGFEANKEDIKEIVKSQNVILQENMQNFKSLKQSTKEQSAEQSTLVKDAIKSVVTVGATVGLLKKEVTEVVNSAKAEMVEAVNISKNEMDNTISEKFESIYADIDNNQNVIVEALGQSADAKTQLAEILISVKDNTDEQKLMIDGVEKVLREVEDKIDDQGVQVDNVEKVLKHINGETEPQLRTETFEDKKENTILINTLKDNLLEYSELRDNNKISFVSFYKNGKIVSSKSFDENGNVVAENEFYDNGELKERKTYYVKNGKTQVEVEKF